MLKNLNTKNIILASQSPRRRDLLSDLGIEFEVIIKPIKEDFPSDIQIDLDLDSGELLEEALKKELG